MVPQEYIPGAPGGPNREGGVPTPCTAAGPPQSPAPQSCPRHTWSHAELAKGGTVILTENGSNESTITVQIPKEWQPTTVNDSVE